MISDLGRYGGELAIGIGGVSRIRRRLQLSLAVSGWLGVVVSFMALVVLVGGWLLEIPAVVSIRDHYAGMAASTAAGFLIAGAAVVHRAFVLRVAESDTAVAIGALLALTGVLNIAMLLAGHELGIDSFFRDAGSSTSGPHMSPATSVCLFFAGVCIAIQDRGPNSLFANLYSVAASAGLTLSAIALVGYMFDVGQLYRIGMFSAMAVHTALGYCILFAAIHLQRPTWGWMRTVVAAGPGSQALRAMLPGVLAAPIFFSWLALSSSVEPSRMNNAALALLALGSVAFLLLLLFRSTARLNREMRAQRITAIRLNKALEERDLLLSEVYHRVKNNLQFVDAMLAIEGSKLSDPEATGVIETVRGRLHSLARVHARILGSQDLATVDLRDLLNDICRDLADGAGLSDRGIRMETDIEAVSLDWERAIPVGLLVNEIVTNAIKHAFPDNRKGLISVSASRSETGISIGIRDDGVGAEAGGTATSSDPAEASSGAMIVATFAQQLGALIETTTGGGTEVAIAVPLP